MAILAGVFSIIACVLLVVLLTRRGRAPDVDQSHTHARLQSLLDAHERAERAVKDELATARRESSESHKGVRDEVGGRLTAFAGTIDESSKGLRSELRSELQQQRDALKAQRDGLQTAIQVQRDELHAALKAQRDEVKAAMDLFGKSSTSSITHLGTQQQERLREFGEQLKGLSDSLDRRFSDLRAGVEKRLELMQADNAGKLELMRATVDEKLQGTLEKRLGESFKQVSDRLEQVHRGLGEMQQLSSGVSDLRRVMTNVKTRGTWGEWQLAALLEELLSPGQFERNFKCKERGGEVVEFAIRLPGPEDDEPCWLPIDSKFPIEDFQRLLAAGEAGDADAVMQAGAALEARVKGCARDIRDKYLSPPRTTNYGVLFLPTESLFAEVLRRPGLCEALQRDFRVTVCGPTTLAAFINALRMGFHTMAIQKKHGEVFKLLGTVKVAHEQFGDLLAGVRKKLDEAVDKLDSAGKKSEQIGRRLRDVDAGTPSLDGSVAAPMLTSGGSLNDDAPAPAADAPDAPGTPRITTRSVGSPLFSD